jgi:hypothetical protein
VKGFNLRIFRRAMGVAVLTAAAAAVTLAGAAPSFASTTTTPLLQKYSVREIATRDAGTGSCSAELLSTQIAATDPAYASAYMLNAHSGKLCLGWLERKTTTGKTWNIVSEIHILSSVPGLTEYGKTGNFPDGPGFEARACLQIGSGTAPACTTAVTLRKSAETVPFDYVPPAYARHTALAGGSLGSTCAAEVSSSTVAKTASSLASGAFVSLGAQCTGWLQLSADGGTTWGTITPIYVIDATATSPAVTAFTGTFTDHTGTLVRTCVRVGDAKVAHCTAGW